MYRLISIYIVLCLSLLRTVAAVDTRTGIFNDRVRSLLVEACGDPMSPPMIVLGTDDWVTISFDHLAEDREYLRCELMHCNADWQPSGLVDNEILDGFNLADINDYAFSQSTLMHYVHYTVTIPNEQMAPMISGNYLLKVFPETDPDDVWLQCRFMVSEQSALIDARVSSVTDIDYNEGHQQLGIVVDSERSRVDDPFNDLMVVVQQNGRLDNQVMLRQPLRMQGRNVSVYEHLKPLIFEAGNEYRRFETVSVNYPGMHVADISYHDPYYHFDLMADTPRADQMYLYDQTQHGRYFVREYNSDVSDIEADYAVVHFYLDMPEIPGATVYIDGDFVNRRFDSEARMVYNHEKGRYERNLLLKQGSYNYQYLVVPNKGARGTTAPIEGDKYQTVNQYTIMVYTRHPGERYDRLIGVTSLTSQ